MTSRPPEPLSRIGLGFAALGRPGYINLVHASDLAGHTDERSMELAAHTVLDAAYAGGVPYLRGRSVLARLRASGVSIGVTVTGPKQAETTERALEVSGFDAVQATWNLLERAAGSAVAEAHAAGVGVIVKWRSRTAD